jgi:hypothetical protein
MSEGFKSGLMLRWNGAPRMDLTSPGAGPTVLLTKENLPGPVGGNDLLRPVSDQPTPPNGGHAGDLSNSPGGGGDISSPVQACLASQPEPPPLRIRVSLFYDGTGNNRINVGLGPQFNSSDSYSAGESNISKLESAGLDPLGQDVDHHLTIYTEGIGTTNRESDNFFPGMSLGIGVTGIAAKVEQGISSAISNICARAHSCGGMGHKIEYIHVDTLGFSRGAAAARYCIWKCMQFTGRTLKERLEAKGLTVGEVVVKFVGLYDTVASYGMKHSNDTAELHLDAISVAEKVVQLAAAEEHRANFRLTNINSTGSRGREIFLPGAHSDIGGGYADTEDEVEWQLFDLDVIYLNKAERAAIERERRWLVASGWYLANELAETNFWNEVIATRRNISNAYSRIPLRIMADFARENGIHIADRLEKKHSIPPELSTANSKIQDYINCTSHSSPGDWFKLNPALDPQWHINLRHKYLHFSARYGTTMCAHTPQWSNDGPVNGQRMRIIQNG